MTTTKQIREQQKRRIGIDNPIVKVCFTFALPGGMWVSYADGHHTYKSFKQLEDEVGEERMEYLQRVASTGGLFGCWHEVK